MAKLEELKVNCRIRGILASGEVTVLNIHWQGPDILEITYRDSSGGLGSELLFRDKEADLEIASPGAVWDFGADGESFRLVSEAYRIRMAYLFDPWMAVHLSLIDPLPHQITAVYEAMLPRQPLRFLLADDPGAGKTIMAGLYIKELMLRGDLQRCLIVCPGALTEQWQDELFSRFQLPFELLTNDRLEAARSGNALQEMPLVIARLDKLSRDPVVQEKLKVTDWDLVIFDEAHKLSASVFNGKINYTKRYQLGQLLADHTRNLLLLTATPHNGKEEDFQLFMALIDPDRFEGVFRKDVHDSNVADLMRRLVKEQLLKFDGTPLFPERFAYTVTYQLSSEEAALYEEVTCYVREEFNRAENLEKGRQGTVGFALTILQRRLASSPEAIYKSLQRRRERLEKEMNKLLLLKHGAEVHLNLAGDLPTFDEEELEDVPEEEFEQAANEVLDLATAAQTIKDLAIEIKRLKELENLAESVRRSGQDRKWTELSRLLQDEDKMFDIGGQRRKLVIFTEHRDTLNYLEQRIRALLGKPDAVVTIHGGMPREVRRNIQASFVQDKDVLVLLATDAAGEGINLQRAHLMVNYDLPWNPNRIEQRFGRIHRIGQTEVCHLWNLVAAETREGDVYARLLNKIEVERQALGDGVFDILGKLFQETSLRDLLVQAIRYGDRPEVRAKLFLAVDNLAERQHVQQLIEERALARDSMDTTRVRQVRQEFERAQARRLQPHFVESFFNAAFERLGGTLHKAEPQRIEINLVPAPIRNRTQAIQHGPILRRYERATFHKESINLPGKPTAEFLCPGHPLVEAVLDMTLEKYRTLLRQGAILVDPDDASDNLRVLYYLEHSVQSSAAVGGTRKVVSRQMQFVEINAKSEVQGAGYAPFLDYQPLPNEKKDLVGPLLELSWLKDDLEAHIRGYASQHLAIQHLRDVQQRREEMVSLSLAAVKDRLTKEIAFWDQRAADLRAQEQAGRVNARLNSELARRRVDELTGRLEKRLQELEQERHVSAQPPVVIGGALIVPAGLLARLEGQPPDLFGRLRKVVEVAAVSAVLESERSSGYEPDDVSRCNYGWDIESTIPGSGKLRFIEVKGRAAGAQTITVTSNEILAGLNKPEDYWLAVVEVNFEGDHPIPKAPEYLLMPFHREPDFAAASVNYDLSDLRQVR